MEYEFTVVVPVFNEEENLSRVEKELAHFLTVADRAASILFVDDGSRDHSLVLLQEMCSRNEERLY